MDGDLVGGVVEEVFAEAAEDHDPESDANARVEGEEGGVLDTGGEVVLFLGILHDAKEAAGHDGDGFDEEDSESGGEDYELLFTGNAAVIDKVKKSAPCPVTVIGKTVADKSGEITLVDREGTPLKLDNKGWEHFATR